MIEKNKLESEKNDVALVTAKQENISELIEIEQKVYYSLENKKIYSPALQVEEWEKEFQNSKVYFVEYQGQNVGSLILEEISSQTSTNHKDLYIAGLVVLPDFQGKGSPVMF